MESLVSALNKISKANRLWRKGSYADCLMLRNKSHLPITTEQKVELIVLTRALHLGRDKTMSIFTDSKYDFR
jgi:hypothetical protein